MTRHLHSRSMSRNLSLSGPDKNSTVWSLPTPPPSLSELSTLACPESPSARAIVPARNQHHTHIPDGHGLLPSSYAPVSQPTSWFTRISSPDVRLPLTRLSAGSVGTWLALYLLCNLALTLHNKHLLNDFPFPWLLTALHAFCAALGSGVCAWRGVFKPAPLNHPTTPLLALFSVLYSANIAASNASLRLVSIATHQVVRAATPLFVVLFAWFGQIGLGAPEQRLRITLAKQRVGCLGVSSAKLKSLTPVILGVVFATYGDYSYTRTGLALTVLGTALAALKTMLASRVVRAGTGLPIFPRVHDRTSAKKPAHTRRVSLKRSPDADELPKRTTVDEGYLSESSSTSEDERTRQSPALHPLDVLLRLSPLACVQCLLAAYLSGELGRWSATTQLTTVDTAHLSMPTGDIDRWTITKLDAAGKWHWRALALNGALAFVLNYVSFVASRRAGPLSMTVAANVKQVLTILLALVVFDTSTPPSVMHLLGIGLTLGGGVWYGLVEIRERREREKEGI